MVVIVNANCLDAMKEMETNSVDSIVTDPPYGLSFMGKKWDYEVPSVAIWVEALRVLKPGGHLLACAGSRTYHRMAVNIEDAGFEIRDQIMWLYGSGFPKSLNISKSIDKKLGAKREMIRMPYSPQQMMMKDGQNERPFQNKARELGYHETMSNEPASEEAKQWNGWGTQLKPAHEPIVLARKPIEGTITENVLEHGVGGMNIDDSRVSHNDPDIVRKDMDSPKGALHMAGDREGERGAGPNPEGRYPANVIHDGSDEVKELMPNTKGGTSQELGDHGHCFAEGERSDKPMAPGYDDEGSAARYFKEAQFSEEEKGRFPANVIHDGSEEVLENFPETGKSAGGRIGNAEGAFSGVGETGFTTKHEKGDPGFGDSGSAARYFKEAQFSEEEKATGHIPIVLARKPIDGTVTENVLEHGIGGLNIDASRVGDFTNTQPSGMNKWNDFRHGDGKYETEETVNIKEGRFPANVIHDGSEKVLEGFPQTKSGEPGIKNKGNDGAAYNAESRPPGTPMTGFGDSGSAARFFYCAKASTAERNAGITESKGSQGAKGGGLRRICEFCGAQQMKPEDCACEVKSWINPLKKNFHPTVKPIALMEYLCRLITPPGGTILDPFMGSGTTGIAALRLGFEFIGLELSEEYVEIASHRIAHWVDADLSFDDGEIVLTKKPQAEWL